MSFVMPRTCESALWCMIIDLEADSLLGIFFERVKFQTMLSRCKHTVSLGIHEMMGR